MAGGMLIINGSKSIEIMTDNATQSYDMNVAQYPVESGEPLTDHSQVQQEAVDVEGRIVGKTWSEANTIASQMNEWQKSNAIVSVKNGVNRPNFLIQNWQKILDEPSKNTVHVSFTIVHIRIPVSSYTKRKNSGKKQPSKASSAVYVTVRGGNTYWGWSMQYGTSIPTLRAWNKWPDRFIPIGARARVK